MANQNQLGGWHVDGGDLGRFASGGTDIPAGLVVIFDGSNPEGLDTPAGVILPAVAASASTARVAGITIDTLTAATGFPGRVRYLGGAVCTANGTIATGTAVTVSTAAGKVGWVIAAATGNLIVGYAENDAVDGDPIVIRMHIGAVSA
jgi:hypothetical protein